MTNTASSNRDSDTALVSVRGEARLILAPDSATLTGALTTVQATKAEALSAAAAALTRLTDDLTTLGAVAHTADSGDRPLTWSAFSATTNPEYDFDNRKGEQTATGRVIASVSVSLVVRDFGLLDPLGRMLAGHDTLNLHQVGWLVDADNPSWPELRAAAIRDAVAKGRDYAAALGGSLVRVEHLADVGLLGGEAPMHVAVGAMARSGVRFGLNSGSSGTPSLDPVPQELFAAVDARFIATVAAL
jgi:uncharacterized protein